MTWTNMRVMAMAFAVEGIVVVGMTILLISGGIDLSVGSVYALSGVTMAMVLRALEPSGALATLSLGLLVSLGVAWLETASAGAQSRRVPRTREGWVLLPSFLPVGVGGRLLGLPR